MPYTKPYAKQHPARLGGRQAGSCAATPPVIVIALTALDPRGTHASQIPEYNEKMHRDADKRSNIAFDQQPLQRVVGRRQTRPMGQPRSPDTALQALLVELSRTRTRTPKGIFRYRTHAEANRDQERWRALAVVARQSADLHGA